MGNMQEIEVKILEVNVADIKKQLLAAGAEHIASLKLEQTLFLKEGFSGLFRIRKSTDANGEVIFYTTLKTPLEKEGVKAADEREKTVESWEAGKEQAAALGFTEKESIHKTREEYRIENVHFCFDTITKPGKIPTYLEIEAEEEALVLAWADKLGFTGDDVKAWGSGKLLEHYGLR